MGQELILASGNAGKLKEFSDLLAPLGWLVRPQSAYQVSEVEETGLTFVENALIKARHAAKITGCAALADDSGLEVDALKGAPGIYSARFAGPGSDDAANNLKLLSSLNAVNAVEPSQRSARYWCVLVFLRSAQDPTPIIVQASWEGVILAASEGDGGFGYDPIFWLPEQGRSAAQLSQAKKNSLSHRGRASQQLLQELQVRGFA